jgi:hypothetical protein
MSSESSSSVTDAGAVLPLRQLPILWPVRRVSRAGRWVAVSVLLASLAVWSVSLWLTPDPRGYGTADQLGCPPCGWIAVYGMPCPTCGMTTAFAHAARFHWVRAFGSQPAGALLAAAVYLAGLVSGYALLTGRCWQINWYRLRPGYVGTAVVLIVLAGWAFKILTFK